MSPSHCRRGPGSRFDWPEKHGVSHRSSVIPCALRHAVTPRRHGTFTRQLSLRDCASTETAGVRPLARPPKQDRIRRAQGSDPVDWVWSTRLALGRVLRPASLAGPHAPTGRLPAGESVGANKNGRAADYSRAANKGEGGAARFLSAGCGWYALARGLVDSSSGDTRSPCSGAFANPVVQREPTSSQ